ncbi:MAG: stalk domain-containing protein [Cellulosilyticaceae bacterium]
MRLHTKLIATLLLAATMSVQVFAAPLQMTYEGKTVGIELETKAMEGKTYIPLRSLCDTMKLPLGWNPKTKEATVKVKDKTIPVATDKLTKTKEGFIEKDRTFVSVQWVEKSLGIKLQGSSATKEEKAVQVAQYLVDGKYQEVVGMMDSVTKTLIDENILKQSWEQVGQSLGKVKSCTFDKGVEANGFYQADVKVIREKAHMKVTTVFNSAGELSGLNMSFYAKEVARPEGVVEKDMVVQTGKYKLPATLTLPKGEGDFPVVVLVHGSGPNDRDETVGGVKPFRDIAYGLAEQGIATLRYDKRTYVHMQEMMMNPSLFDYEEEVIEDALSAVELMKNTPQINKDQIFVLGHSLGAMSIPMISSKDTGVAGYVMVAGPARNLVDVVLEQVDYLATVQGMPQAQKEMYVQMVTQQAEAVRALTPTSTVAEMNFMGINNKVWGDLNVYDQVAVAKTMTEPLLVIQGGRDYQVTMEDFKLWEQNLSGMANVTLKDYADLNHILITGEGKSVPDEYYMPAEVSGEVIKDLASFINKK